MSSRCCGRQEAMVDIYLMVAAGRHILGQVRLCTGCQKPTGEPTRYKGGGAKLTDTAWAKMLQAHPIAPFYFVPAGDGIEPEGTVRPQIAQNGPPVIPATQEAAPPENAAPPQTSPAPQPEKEEEPEPEDEDRYWQ